MRKIYFLTLWGGILCQLLLIGCKEDGANKTNFDPNLPVKLTEFLPDSGGIRTKFIIKGENFGNDKNKVKVLFTDSEGNERESLILGLNSGTIYTQVPKQLGGESSLRVIVEEKEAEVVNPTKTFKYIVAASVSTVVGKAKEQGQTNGTVGETTFKGPKYLVVDEDDNLIITDDTKLRLVSIAQNKSLDLFSGFTMEQPVLLDNAGKKTLWPCTMAAGGVHFFDSEIGWIDENYGYILPSGAWISGILLAPCNPDYLITRQNTGEIWVHKFKKPLRPEAENRIQIGVVRQGGSNSPMVYNPVDGYIYCSLHTQSGIYRFKLKNGPEGYPVFDGDVEEYINNGAGFADGGVDEARFNQPHGIAVDSEGDLYVADTMNHRIRKINTKTNTVITVAGTTVASYKDDVPEEALFNQPWGVFVDKNDFVYIADGKNFCIRKLAIE